jgi:hypothetical protein
MAVSDSEHFVRRVAVLPPGTPRGRTMNDTTRGKDANAKSKDGTESKGERWRTRREKIERSANSLDTRQDTRSGGGKRRKCRNAAC